MSEIMERDLVRELQLKGVNKSLSTLLAAEIMPEMKGYLGSLINQTINDTGATRSSGIAINCSKEVLTKLDLALQTCVNNITSDDWLVRALDESLLDGKSEEDQKSLLAEIEAFGFLSSVFGNGNVKQIKEGKKKTPDFEILGGVYAEVYCPDLSKDHKDLVSTLNELDDSECTEGFKVKSVLTRPLTGNKPLAVKYASNQVVNRIISDKREKDQTYQDKQNILWLDLSYKTELLVQDCLPYRSINYCDQTYVGCTGVWHAFYGEKELSRFPKERFSLLFSTGVESETYSQRDYTGLFRERDTLSAAIISCKDGLVLFQNPWADSNCKLTEKTLKNLIKLPMFRPELSWFTLDNTSLQQRIDQSIKDLNWLLLAKK